MSSTALDRQSAAGKGHDAWHADNNSAVKSFVPTIESSEQVDVQSLYLGSPDESFREDTAEWGISDEPFSDHTWPGTPVTTEDPPINESTRSTSDGDCRDADIDESEEAMTTAGVDAHEDKSLDSSVRMIRLHVRGDMFKRKHIFKRSRSKKTTGKPSPKKRPPTKRSDEAKRTRTTKRSRSKKTTGTSSPKKNRLKDCPMKVAIWLLKYYGSEKKEVGRLTGLNPHYPRTMVRILDDKMLKKWMEEVGLSAKIIPLVVKRFIPDFEPTGRPDLTWENSGRGCSCGTTKPQRLQINEVYRGSYGGFKATGYKQGRCYIHGKIPEELDFVQVETSNEAKERKRKNTSADTNTKKRSR